MLYTVALISMLAFVAQQCNGKLVVDNDKFTIWTIPDNAVDMANIATTAGTALIGGGENCEPAFAYMIQNANKGDFIILRASSDDSYNDYVYDLSKKIGSTLNSVTTILFKTRDAAFEQEVTSRLSAAEAIFFAGGDQTKYLNFWANTPVQTISQSKVDNGVTIGGTSAGLAILGNWIYSAEQGSAYSDESLENPYNIYLTFANRFLNIPFMQNTITDTHFHARDRMGRMLSFAARVKTDYKPEIIHAMGVDEQTALLLNTRNGEVSTVGVGKAYVCSAKEPEQCKDGMPLIYRDIGCVRLDSQTSDQFSFATWSGAGVPYTTDIIDGKIVGAPYGPNK